MKDLCMMLLLIFLAVIGFFISAYAYYVEKKIRQEPGFKPFCDINNKISCTKPIKSIYSNLFFFSNAFVGMFYYMVITFLAFLDARTFLIIIASISMIITCYLAYILYFKIKSFCLLCTSVYLINLILFLMLIF